MADFSFLNTGAGPDVEDDEATNAENQGFEAAHAAASKTPIRFNLDSEGPTGEFQQKRAKAADFAKQQTLKGLDQLSNAHTANYQQMAQVGGEDAVSSIQPLDYEGTKQRIFSTTPENYAQVLYNEAQKHHLPEDQIAGIMRPSEEAVTAYKQLQMENQVPQHEIQESLKPGDIANAKMQMASLDQTIEQTRQKMALSATSRQRNELKNALDFYDSQKRMLQAKIPPEPAQQDEMGINDPHVTMDHAFTAAGIPRQEAIQSLTEMRRLVSMEGIAASAPVSPLSFIPTYTNLISHIFNPQVAGKMLAEMAPREQEPQQQPQGGARQPQQSTFGSDKLEQDPRFQQNQQMIQQKQDRHAQVVQELANSGTFKNVGDVLGFVLTSFLLGPRVAGLFFSNMEKNGRLRDELNMLDHETTGLYHQQNSYIQLAQHARSMAAGEEHQQAQEAETARHHWAVEQYMRGKQTDTSKLSTEDKSTHQALQQSLRSHYADVQAQQRQLKIAEGIVKNGDPRDPDYKWLITPDKSGKAPISRQRQKLQEAENTYQTWRDTTVMPWYEKRGIKFIDPNKGTKVDEGTFAAPANE